MTAIVQTACSNRRSFVRTIAGGLFALPWVESLAGERKSSEDSQSPQRFAFLYTPNGYNQATFLPSGGSLDKDLPLALQPLDPVRQHVSLLSGLDRRFVPGTGVHAQCGSCWLTSSAPDETLDGGFPTNTTIDQLLARRLGGDTLLPSLELSCNDFSNSKETKYFECISWYGPGHSAQTEKNPREVFKRLFGQPDGMALNRSVLDRVERSAIRLSPRLSRADRGRLEEYLESVRQTERRVQRAESLAAERADAPLNQPAGVPGHRGEYVSLMLDLIAHAFELDLTRVATLVVDPERWDSPRMFDGVFESPQNHHVLTHTKGEEAKAKLAKIDQFHVGLFAKFVNKLQSIPVGTATTLLDRTSVAMGSGISDGDRHNYADLQVLLAGGLTERIGYREYAGNRPLADLWLTLGRRAGLGLSRFADSQGVIDGI